MQKACKDEQLAVFGAEHERSAADVLDIDAALGSWNRYAMDESASQVQ